MSLHLRVEVPRPKFSLGAALYALLSGVCLQLEVSTDRVMLLSNVEGQ